MTVIQKSLQLANGVLLTNAGNVDPLYGPFTSTADADASVNIALRPYRTVGVVISGTVVEYWWPTTTCPDGSLVIKLSPGTFASLSGAPVDNAALGAALAAKADKLLTGLDTSTLTPITATDTVLSAAGKLQAQVTDRYTKEQIDVTVASLNQSTVFEIYKQQNFY